MIQTADIKPKVMRLWGNPSTTELSPQALRDAIESVWNIVVMEMSIVSPLYHAVFSEPFNLSDGWTGSVPVDDLAVPIAVEYRSGNTYTESDWTQLDTAGIENWDFYKANNQPVALLTGGVSGLTLKTNFDASGGEFRLRYISDGQIGDASAPLGQAIELPSFFSPMFEKGAAAFAGDFIVSDRELYITTVPAKQQAFNNEFLMYLDRFKQWLRSSRSGKGVLFRTASNASRRNGGRRWNTGFPR